MKGGLEKRAQGWLDSREDAVFATEKGMAHSLTGLLSSIRAETTQDVVDWAVERWNAEVSNRPLQNIHRRTLDDTWRQVIRHLGGDDVILCGPAHDELLAT